MGKRVMGPTASMALKHTWSFRDQTFTYYNVFITSLCLYRWILHNEIDGSNKIFRSHEITRQWDLVAHEKAFIPKMFIHEPQSGRSTKYSAILVFFSPRAESATIYAFPDRKKGACMRNIAAANHRKNGCVAQECLTTVQSFQLQFS